MYPSIREGITIPTWHQLRLPSQGGQPALAEAQLQDLQKHRRRGRVQGAAPVATQLCLGEKD